MRKKDFLESIPEDPAEVLANWRDIRQRIDDQFKQASTWEEWTTLHALRDSVLNLVKPTINPDDQAKFQEAGENIYKLHIVQECTIDGQICVETLDAVTRREIDTGRMSPKHKFRHTAEMGMRAPHFTRAQLLQAEAEKHGYIFAPPPTGLRRILNFFKRS
jgi:hypothetical protein